MDEKHALKYFADILNNLNDYGVIRNKSDSLLEYTIYSTKTNSFVLIEDDSDGLAKIMIQKGVKIFNTIDEARNPDYEGFCLKWDEQKQEWIKLYFRDLGSI